MASVGVIVNPWAGKDVRRLHAPVGHTSDTTKLGIVRRIVVGARDAGAERVAVLRDASGIAERAVADVDGAELVDSAGTGSALDSRRGAAQLAARGCVPIVVLGGDGTCRDASIGAPGTPMIPISTGTNNVFPRMIDGSSAGTAAGLIASGALAVEAVGTPTKVLHVTVRERGEAAEDLALVDVAMIEGTGTGARAVVRSETVRWVVAAIASPATTGLSAIAGRVHPVGRHEPGAVVVRTGAGARMVRVPIVPGIYHDIPIASIETFDDGDSIEFAGPGVLAFDGERERTVGADAVITVTVRRDGPIVVDVHRALACAAHLRLFDVPTALLAGEADHGD